MSRYIDYDAIDYKHYQLHDKSEEFLNGVIYMAQRIEDAPSIDIVRCKECKWLRYCETEDLDLYLDCDKLDGGGIPRSENWFCADGEREGEL